MVLLAKHKTLSTVILIILMQMCFFYLQLLTALSDTNSVSTIDQASRVLFPAAFVAFHVFYWVSYLHADDDVGRRIPWMHIYIVSHIMLNHDIDLYHCHTKQRIGRRCPVLVWQRICFLPCSFGVRTTLQYRISTMEILTYLFATYFYSHSPCKQLVNIPIELVQQFKE